MKTTIKMASPMPFQLSPLNNLNTVVYPPLFPVGSPISAQCGLKLEIQEVAYNKSEIQHKVHAIIDKFAELGLRYLAVARQEVLEGTKDSPGGPWEFVGLLPLFDPPRHDSGETIRRALDLGVSVKIITGICHYYLIC